MGSADWNAIPHASPSKKYNSEDTVAVVTVNKRYITARTTKTLDSVFFQNNSVVECRDFFC